MNARPDNLTKRSIGVRVFGYCVNKLWLLFASLIVIAALIHLALGLLLPKIDLYQQEIINWVEENYDINVEVEKISAEWSIEGPVIALSDFVIKSEDGEYNVLEVGEVSLYFDMLTSLWDQRFSTKEIVIDHADLKFYIDQKLGVQLDTGANKSTKNQINSPSSIELGDSSQKLIDILFGQRKISITDSTLKLFTLRGTQFDYHIDLIKVEKFSQVHQLSGQLDYGDAGQISIVTEIYGDPKLESSFSEIYLRGTNVGIAELPWLDSFPIARPGSGELSWQFWGTWRDTHWQSASAVVDLKNTSLSELTDKQPDNQLSGMLSWQHDENDKGYLSVHNMSLLTLSTRSAKVKKNIQQGNQPILPEIYLKYQDFGNSDLSWVMRAEDLSVGPLINYLGYVSDEKQEYAQFLKTSKFSLLVNQLRLSMEKLNNNWQSPIIEFEFSELEYERWHNLPRANGLSGKVKIDQLGGSAELSAVDIDLEFGELFRHAIKVDKLNSDFSWSFNRAGQIQLYVNNFGLANPDLNIQARSAFFYQEDKPVFSLYTELTNVNAANKSQYLPVGVMSDNLVSYIDAGVKSGYFPIIKSLVRGPISNFPFSDDSGLFVALGMLKNATYQYLPDWPVATELDAKLLFEGNGMDIIATNANSLNNQVLAARAIAKDFSLAEPILELSLDVASKNNSARELISLTPINFISDSLQTIDYFGNIRTNINLKVGLADDGQLTLRGRVQLDPEGSKIVTPIISADNIKGEIKFTENGIQPSKVEAIYLNKKLEIELVGKEKAESPTLSLDVKGFLPAAGISHFIGARWNKYFDGEAEFSSLIQFSPVDKPEVTRVFFQSELEGLSIDFPDEFGKQKNEKNEIFLTLELAKHSTGEIKWKGMDGRWYWDETLAELNQSSKESSGEEVINKTVNLVQEIHQQDNNFPINYGATIFVNWEGDHQRELEPGLSVYANLEKLDLSSWLSFVQSFDTSSEGESSQPLVFESIEANIKELYSPLVMVKDSRLKLEKKLNLPWKVYLQSEQGNLDLRLNTHRPWDAILSDINIHLTEELFEEQQSTEKSDSLLPSDLVDMNIQCTGCIFQDKDYGDIVLQLRKQDRGIRFNGKTIKNKQHDLVLSGSWQQNDQLEIETHVQLDLQSPNIGNLLKKWELDAAIEDSPVKLVAELSWQDSPWEFDYSLADADIQLNLGKGYLSEISDQKGRLFSLFNLQSLVRKLTFDFKDVYKKGFFYDSIKGTFQLREGIISTENVEIKGNVADVKLYGETDVKNEKIEQMAIITPHLTSSLPVLAAWAIEPTTGIIVFLLDKIMEPAVEVATRIDYRIHGSFDEVKVDTIKTSKEKVKVEYQSELEPETEEKKPTDSKIDKAKIEIKHGKAGQKNETVGQPFNLGKVEKESPEEEPVPL